MNSCTVEQNFENARRRLAEYRESADSLYSAICSWLHVSVTKWLVSSRKKAKVDQDILYYCILCFGYEYCVMLWPLTPDFKLEIIHSGTLCTEVGTKTGGGTLSVDEFLKAPYGLCVSCLCDLLLNSGYCWSVAIANYQHKGAQRSLP